MESDFRDKPHPLARAQYFSAAYEEVTDAPHFDGNLILHERESVSTYFERRSMKAGGDYANDHSGRRKNQASREIYFRGTDGR
jgi:hypothetical protein